MSIRVVHSHYVFNNTTRAIIMSPDG